MSLIQKLLKEISLNSHFDNELHHGTQIISLEHIKEHGFHKDTYFGSYRIADYYAGNPPDNVYGRGGEAEPVIISIPIKYFNKRFFTVDYNSVDEPLSYTLERSEDDIWDDWNNSDKNVQASLDILESIIYTKELPWNDEFKIEYI